MNPSAQDISPTSQILMFMFTWNQPCPHVAAETQIQYRGEVDSISPSATRLDTPPIPGVCAYAEDSDRRNGRDQDVDLLY